MNSSFENCGKCKGVVRLGVQCHDCKLWYHRKCEGVKKGKYIDKCKRCVNFVDVSGSFSSKGEEDEEESCAKCPDLEKRVKSVRYQYEAVVEINKDLLAEIEKLKTELQVLKQKLKEGELKQVVNRSGSTRSGSDVVSNATNNTLLQEKVPVEKLASHVIKPKGKKKVLLLSCSQGRMCSNLLQERLGDNFEVSSIVKPNAQLKDVVCDADKLVKNFNENDCLIVLGGSNDMDGNYQKTIPEGLNKVLSLSKKTNVILNSVPTRFDRFDLRDHVRNANRIIRSQVNRFPDKKPANIRVNSSMERLSRECYTRQGLHLNLKGKSELCTGLSSLVLSCVGNSSNFLVNTGLIKETR